MSEFKYACPVCGQHIKCDSSQSGSTMECPTCFQKIIAPQAPATDDPKFIITGTKVGGERPIPSAVVVNPGTGMTPDKKFSGTAIVLLIFICIAGAVGFVYRGTIFKSKDANAGAPVATNQTSAKPTVVAPVANDTNWTLNLDSVTNLPDAPAGGRIHGQNFIYERAYLEGGTLSLRTPNHGPLDLGVSIYLHANQGQDLAGQSVNIASDLTNAPRVTLRWKENQQMMTESFKTGYALRIEFGELDGNRLPGKIYLCTPDETKSYVAGTFNAEIRKPKPPKQKN